MELPELINELTVIYNSGLDSELQANWIVLKYGSFAYQKPEPDKIGSILNQIDSREWAEKLYKPNK